MNKHSLNALERRTEAIAPTPEICPGIPVMAYLRDPIDTDYCTYWSRWQVENRVKLGGVLFYCPFHRDKAGAGLGDIPATTQQPTGEPQDGRSCRECEHWMPPKHYTGSREKND